MQKSKEVFLNLSCFARVTDLFQTLMEEMKPDGVEKTDFKKKDANIEAIFGVFRLSGLQFKVETRRFYKLLLFHKCCVFGVEIVDKKSDLQPTRNQCDYRGQKY